MIFVEHKLEDRTFGGREFVTETELKADGFTDGMIDELLGSPVNELAEQVDDFYKDVGERLWRAVDVNDAKDRAIAARLQASRSETAADAGDGWEPPEGFVSAKQARAMGFTKRRLDKLPNSAVVVPEELGGRKVKIWRTEDVEAAMSTPSFRRKQRQMKTHERKRAWNEVCGEYRAAEA